MSSDKLRINSIKIVTTMYFGVTLIFPISTFLLMYICYKCIDAYFFSFYTSGSMTNLLKKQITVLFNIIKIILY